MIKVCCPIELCIMNDIQVVSYGVPLRLRRSLIKCCLVGIVLVLCDMYMICQESNHVVVVDHPHRGRGVVSLLTPQL